MNQIATAAQAYLCPLCATPLKQALRSFKCENNHSFDIAKQGYVNLLPVSHKKSKQPGDSKAMLQERQQFLDQGFYQPLLTPLIEQLTANKPSQLALLDLGCGEGYYSQQLYQQLTKLGLSVELYGLDIAKPAVLMAAKRVPEAHFCVASSFRPPYHEHYFDAIVTVFAPVELTQISRVLTQTGKWIRVTPGENHLKELKQQVYDHVQPHKENMTPPAGFEITNTQQSKFTIQLNNKQLNALVAMTPFVWQLTAEKQQALLSLNQLSVSCDFTISTYRRLNH